MKTALLSAIALATMQSSAMPHASAPKSINHTNPPCPTDISLLQFALYFENFQNAFYRQGLANFTAADFAAAGHTADFYTNLTAIASQEQTHVQSLVTTLTSLDAPTVAECNWDFNVTTPAGFVTTAALIEGVGVSSYLGIVVKFEDPGLQEVAASAMAVEASHSGFVRAAQGLPPFASPFDTPLDMEEAYTLAELFTVECPKSNPDFHLKKFPQMSSSFSNHGVIGGEITLLTFGNNIEPVAGSKQVYAAFLTLTGPVFAPATPVPGLGFNVTVPTAPKGYAPINGLTHVVLTSFDTTLRDEDILAGPASLEIYAH